MDEINQLINTRNIFVKMLDQISKEELFNIPDNFNNNIIWNIGHLAITQQLLNYKLSGLPLYVNDKAIEMLGKDSSPKNWKEDIDVQQIKSWLTELPAKLKEDYANGLFKEFNTYTTSAGVTLNNVDDAIRFNNFHEGLHLGYIMAMRKSL